MKTIDVKSLLIGILATALLFACADADKISPSIVSEAKAATGVNDKWDMNQEWEFTAVTGAASKKELMEKIGFFEGTMDKDGKITHSRSTNGWEPFAGVGNHLHFRRRVN